MKTHRLAMVMMIALVIGGLAQNGSAQQVTMQVDAAKVGAPISSNLYGFFTEFLSNMYEGGLWAEMLGDRKFFYPVDSSEKLNPPNSRRGVGRWRPVGPDSAITMDKARAYVGEHSPQITVDPSTPYGIQQAGLGLKKGNQYSGRVIVAADPGVQVSASLIWGEGAADRQTLAVKAGKEYTKFPLKFVAGADTENARLEITGTGKGSFHVGAVSLMPADNIDGYRADQVKLYKDIGVTLIRWPGGNFTSGYDWRDGIGDADKRPPRYDYAWNALENNDMGIDDFMKLVKLLGVEPYLCVNTGFGDAFSAAQEVEYVNGAASTPMGKLRAANGHPDPYKIRYWNVGNEMYGAWQLGHMSLEHYTIKHNMIVEAMRKVDPTIYVIASGATPAEMTTTEAGKQITGKPVTEFGDPQADWTGGLVTRSHAYLNSIAEHAYPRAAEAFDPQKQAFVKVDDSLADKARRLPNRVRCAAEAWDEYQKRNPTVDMSKITISLDEWMPGRMQGGGEIFTMLTTAEGLNEMFRHSDKYEFSGYTALSMLLSYNKTDATVRPLGLMFKLYRRHFGSIPVAVTGNSPQHDVAGVVNVDKPKVPSGSDTYPLDVVAALTADKKTLTVAVVNPTEQAQTVDATFAGVSLQGGGKVWQIAPSSMNVRNEIGKPPAVEIAGSNLSTAPGKLSVPPISVTIYELPVR